MLNEEEAKEKLEKDSGISFDYSQAKYDENIKKWAFFVVNKDGKRLFRANCKEDFEPYIALAKHLNMECKELLSKYVWVYGNEIEAGSDEGTDLYCYTNVGWISIKDIEEFFIEKFGKCAKNHLLHNETWKLVIYRNECSSSTYKKNEKPGFPPINTTVSIKLEELKEKVIKIEAVEESIENNEQFDLHTGIALVENNEDSNTLPSNIKEEVKSVLSYLDQLLDSLPEDKIKEFADSKYFEMYRRLFTELGISYEDVKTSENDGGSNTLPSNMKEEVKSVLSYLDQLLDSLPEDKIEEFTDSKYFEMYRRLFTELDIS